MANILIFTILLLHEDDPIDFDMDSTNIGTGASSDNPQVSADIDTNANGNNNNNNIIEPVGDGSIIDGGTCPIQSNVQNGR